MTVLVVGLSHRTASVGMLEKAVVAADDLRKTLEELRRSDTIGEVVLLSTCNRVEVYADVARFHPAVAEIGAVLSRHSGVPVGELTEYLYVHFAEAAVEHLLTVACGLDSMVVGESQILGQLRSAYTLATEVGSVGTVLHELAQTALRVGKRAHAETGIDRAGASVVSVALDRAERMLGPLAGRNVLIVGAGSMGALAGASLRRRGVTDLVVANRSPERGARLAATLEGTAAALSELPERIAGADLLVCSTGAAGIVVDAAQVRPRDGRPLMVLDLAVPRDVAPEVAGLPHVSYLDIDALHGGPGTAELVSDSDVAEATAIVTEELGRYLAGQHQLAVAPTVTALRARATQVIDAELGRLDARLPGLQPELRRELADTVRRTVEKLLHAPTVRVKEFAALPGGAQYANALRELFDLDPAAAESVAAVKAPPATPGESRGTR
jgi:glutamyl-tRNA reductase